MKRSQLPVAVVLSLFSLAFAAYAQDKLLTLDDIFSPDATKRVRFGGAPVPVQWAADGRSFKQMIGGRLMRVDAVTGQATPYLNNRALNDALLKAGIKGELADAIANSPAHQFNAAESAVLINHNADLWYYDIRTDTLRRLTTNKDQEKEADFSPDGRWVSFVRGNDLFVVDVTNAREKQLTRDGREGDKAIYNGYLDWVYEEELYGRGSRRGYWWSPDSKQIAFLRLDESNVPRFTIANDVVTDQIIEIENYPQAGDPNPIVRLGVADVTKAPFMPNVGRIPLVGSRLPSSVKNIGDAVKFVDLSQYKPEDLLIARVAWSRDSGIVMYQALNREQTWLDLNAYELPTGKTIKALQETTPASVEVYSNPIQLYQSGDFIWESARNGWKHLYRYDGKSLTPRQLTSGKWEVRTVYGVDEKNEWVYFSATKDSHIAENIYRVSINGGEPERLSKGDGWHAASFNKDLTLYVENWSDVTTPTQTRLFKADGTLSRILNENKVDVLSQYKLSKPEFMQVKTRDGFEMEAMMIKPPDFDPTKKYPVFQFTYAGPHAPSVADRWGGNRGMWFQLLAQKGYIVWVCDNRSASGKGAEAVWPIYKRMYELELRDIEDGLNYLKTLPYVDPTRIGLHGWSYGGSMTSYALTHSKSFKIGIAGGTVSDWRLYDSIYTERYMGLPQTNAAAYDRTSITKAAANLHGRLLLIHGAMDDNVHMQNTVQFANDLQLAGKQFELMIYPTQRHGITNPSQLHHMYTMMTEFILKNL